MISDGAQDAVEAAFREEWGRVVATLIRRTGDWDLAEDSAQEAFAEALRRWPVEGVPRRPGAWLTTVAGNRALDRLRRSRPAMAQAMLGTADTDAVWEVLAPLLRLDEPDPGSAWLGEVALVDGGSPVGRSGRVFIRTR